MLKRKLALLLLIGWLLPALACNLPRAPRTPTPAANQAVQETLAAQLFATLPAGVPQPSLAPTGQAFPGLATATVGAAAPTAPGTAPFGAVQTPPPGSDYILYYTQSGDTAAGLAGRFGVRPEQIIDLSQYSAQAWLPIGQLVPVPNSLIGLEIPYQAAVLPDSEIVNSPSAAGFSVAEAVQAGGGFLSTYSEVIDGQTLTGAQVIERVAFETSISPRLLLAVLEYRSGWVRGQPADPAQTAYPIGFYANEYSGLLKEITLTARQLTLGYYGWRSGQVTELEFANGARARLSPTLNAGSVAVQYLFSKLYTPAQLQDVLYGADSFVNRYQAWYGDPWQRAAELGPILPFGLQQPVLELPFLPGINWSFTGGPHAAWGVGSPWGGLDFAPASVEKGCTVSHFWATASAPGIVTRSANGIVVLDLDMDGYEQTGWSLMYLHLAESERVAAGTQVNTDDRLGHPSCEGGFSTGTHVHLSRKYNGEWLAADGPAPFVLSGWQAWQDTKAYSGTLVKGDQIVTARPDGSHTSIISR
jgi:murein DD-endopeptidase MepM/ murein hydrolase activator NlpD